MCSKKNNLPNILICGNMGVGKTTLCGEIIKCVDFNCLDVAKIAKARDCISGYDVEFDVPMIDPKKIVAELDPVLQSGGNMVEYYTSAIFPAHWFDYVFVLTADVAILGNRLTKKGYSSGKISSIIDSESFQVPYEEATVVFSEERVYKLISNMDEDMERNIAFIVSKTNENNAAHGTLRLV